MRKGWSWCAGALFVLAGCRSPFEPVREAAEEDSRVGQGIHAWPLFERAPGEKETRTDVLWPLASLRSDEEGSLVSAEIVYPIGHWLDTDDAFEFGLRPLFQSKTRFASKDAPEQFDFYAVAGLFDWEDEGASSVRRALIVDSRTDGPSSYFTVFPLLWTKSAPREDYFHLWPLYGVEHEGSFTKHWALTPFFAVEEDPAKDLTAWDALWPLFHVGREKDAVHVRALPLYWHDATSDASTTFVFPFWGRQSCGTSFERSFFGPLWIDTRNGASRSTDLLWPLVNWESGAHSDRWSWRGAPFLFFGQEGERRSHAHVFPFYGSWQHDDDHGWYGPAGVVIHEETPTETSWNFVGPLIRTATRDDGYELTVRPLFSVERRGTRRENGLGLGILANWVTNEFVTKERRVVPTNEGSVLLGLVAHWKARFADRRWSVLTPLVVSSEIDDAKKTSEWSVLWRLVHATTTEHKSVFAINPLYRHETNDRGDEFWSVLFGLVAHKRESGESSWRLLWLF